MALMHTSDLPLSRVAQGKVRDVYAVDADRLLLIATDRVSAFDVVMGEAVPHKGRVLTQLNAWWCRQLDGVVPHHLISADADEIVRAVPALLPHRGAIDGRATPVPASQGVSGRMCRPWLSCRLGLEGISRLRHIGRGNLAKGDA
jgi:phosphoribosylaminoimidazole-succinocarboxamide synthase